jgi:tetratricopeptide (TPR) repeat protein
MNIQAKAHRQRPNGRRKRRYAQYGLGILALAMAVATTVASDHQGTAESIVEELEQTDLFFARTSDSRLFDRLRKDGELLSSEQATTLEKKLQQNQKDLPSRVVLMGYHKKLGGRHPPSLGPYGQLVLGIIKHHPRSKLSTATGYMLLRREGKMGDGEAWAQGSQLWLDLAETHPADAQISGNAGIYHYIEIFRPLAREHAIDLLKRAHELDPENPRWVWYLGDIYTSKSRVFSTPDEQRKAFAKQALDYLEESFRLSDEQLRSVMEGQSTLAFAAFTAEEFEKAKTYATEQLSSVNRKEAGWDYGNVIHNMNVLLGRTALRQGNLEEAKQYLLKAGKSPGSPQLNSFGPQFTFARELLEKGEKSVVIEYLDLIGEFWANPESRNQSNPNSLRNARDHARQLAKWKKEILEDKIPQDRKWR